MAIRLKDLTKGSLSREWLNRLIKDEARDADPTERGERDKDLWRVRKEGAPYLPKRKRGKG